MRCAEIRVFVATVLSFWLPCSLSRRGVCVAAALLLCNAAVADDGNALIRERHGHVPWKSDFATAISDDDLAAVPITEARARWDSMTDAERKEVLADEHRSHIRGGIFIPWPEPEAAPATAEGKKVDGKKTDKKKTADKKKSAKSKAASN